MIAICGVYFGLAQPIIQHFTAPITVRNIPTLQEKVTVRPEPPKLDDHKLHIDPPETPWNLPADPDAAVTVDRAPAHATPIVVETAPAHAALPATSVQMDPRHPLKNRPRLLSRRRDPTRARGTMCRAGHGGG
jgi:hypothetical protein